MTREEAFLIFDKLRSDDAIVFCMGRLWGWTIALRGKVVSARREEVIIVSTDRQSGSMSLSLDMEDLMIRYAEQREVPMLQGDRDPTLVSLMVSLPLRIRPADLKKRLVEAPPRELLFIIELPQQPPNGETLQEPPRGPNG
jgi:hypothetical protein